MKIRNILVSLLVISLLLLPTLVACGGEELEEPAANGGEGWLWYGPGNPGWAVPEQGEDLNYWNWGTLLPNEPEVLIEEGDSWAVYKRGDFKGYSIVFPLDNGGLFPPDWLERVLEVYPDYVVEIIPEGGFPYPPRMPDFRHILDTRKHEDGTYTTGIPHCGLLHYDRTGKVIHFVEDEEISHEAQILPNGHLFVCFPVTAVAREMDWDGNVYWEYRANEHMLPYSEQDILNLKEDSKFEDPMVLVRDHYNGSICLNSAQALPGGHHLLSFRNANLVVELDENDKVVWTFGPMVLKHQHCVTKLETGNVLIEDSCGMRVIEVSPSHEIVWEFNSGMVSTYQGTAQRLPDGNTLITDTYRTVAFCVTPDKKVLWEVYVKGKDALTLTEALEFQDEVLPGFRIYRAWAYPIGFGD